MSVYLMVDFQIFPPQNPQPRTPHPLLSYLNMFRYKSDSKYMYVCMNVYIYTNLCTYKLYDYTYLCEQPHEYKYRNK